MPAILLTTLNSKYIHMNLAIRILYDLNHDKGNLDWVEFTIKSPIEEMVDYYSKYEVVCFSCYIWNITPTLAVCRALKAAHPNVKVLLGGPEVSYEWEGVIAADEIDYIIIGEGEVPFAQFVQSYPLVKNSVANLISKEDGQVHYNKQDVQFDVSELSGRNPYQYDPVEDLSKKVSYIETSRGCPYKCEFCLASLDNKVRYLDMDTIESNLAYLMEHGRVVKFLDRTFNIKKDFTIKLFKFILERYQPKNVFQFEITADIVHPDIIAFVNEFVPPGIFRFEIGIQTVNKESNLEVGRKQNFDKTASVIKQLEERIEMHLDLIVGLPLEYFPDLKYSFEKTFALYPPELQLGFLKFLKGTPMRDKVEKFGYVFDPEPPYQIIESNFLSKEELEQIILVEEALEVYWNKKRACHTMRYIAQNHSIFDCFLGLGALLRQKVGDSQMGLKDMYLVLKSYIEDNYSDPGLLDLVALDYFLYHKVKPQDIYGLELDRKAHFEFIETHGLNHHQFRYSIIPSSKDLHLFISKDEWQDLNGHLVVEYNGQDSGRLVQPEELKGDS